MEDEAGYKSKFGRILVKKPAAGFPFVPKFVGAQNNSAAEKVKIYRKNNTQLINKKS